MSEIVSIEIDCADDGSFALNRALWRHKLIEVNIISDKKAPKDSLGNYVVSFWGEGEDGPRDEMRTRVEGILQGPVLEVLKSSQMASLSSVVLVDVRTDVPTGSLLVSVVDQPNTSLYAQRLDAPSKFIDAASPSHIPAICELESIIFLSALESDSTGVYLVKTKNDAPPVVLKLLLPTDFLLHSDEEAFSFTARLAAMYREILVLSTIPPHPNIIDCPVALVTISHLHGQLVCGFLSSFHPGGTIASAIEPVTPADTPSLERRIRWAAQMASAIFHLHLVAHTYHGDIKLDNIILSANDNAVFIDFEQVRHAKECLAPEACGAWDVVLTNSAARDFVGATTTATISYVPYTGPEREETWSAYEAWAMYPEALEAIEVYSLGDALKTLFEGTCLPNKVRTIIEQCMAEEPEARPRLDFILAGMRELCPEVDQ